MGQSVVWLGSCGVEDMIRPAPSGWSPCRLAHGSWLMIESRSRLWNTATPLNIVHLYFTFFFLSKLDLYFTHK